MPATAGTLVSPGTCLMSKSSNFVAPEKVNVALAMFISTSDDVAMILTLAGNLLWTMRYTCESLA